MQPSPTDLPSENDLWKHRALRFGLAIAAGVLCEIFAPSWLRGTVRLVASYDVAAAIVLIFYFVSVFRDDERLTERRAAVNDPGRNIIQTVVVVSVVAGLAAAIEILGKGPDVQTTSQRMIAVLLGLSAATLGWLLTHATFALRYAHLYYRDDGTPGDGLVFPLTPRPDDYDFLYFSFVIGMTFQVSDVQVTDPGIRRLVLVHGLISFGYNTAILALGINLISNLLH